MHRARAASTPGDQPYRRSLAIIPQLAPHHEPVAAAIRTGDRKRAAGRPPRIFLIFGNGPKLEENHRPIHSPRYPFGFRTKGCVMDGSNSALSRKDFFLDKARLKFRVDRPVEVRSLLISLLNDSSDSGSCRFVDRVVGFHDPVKSLLICYGKGFCLSCCTRFGLLHTKPTFTAGSVGALLRAISPRL